VGSLRGPSNRRSYTRTRATSLSFSWRGRLAWSAPPILFLLWLMSGPLGAFNPLAWFMGAVMTGFTIWWLRQVWTRTPLPPVLPDISVPTDDHDDLVGSDRVAPVWHDESVMIIATGDAGSATAAAADVPGPTGT
jgi:hypothetical protein